MSVKAQYVDGVFKPLEKVTGALAGGVYRGFSEEELRNLTDSFFWLKAAEKSFAFWDNEEDAVYDNL